MHTGYSECSLDASAVLRNETSCKENRKYILTSTTIRASNTLSIGLPQEKRSRRVSLSNLLELSLFSAKSMFWFCVNQSDYGKSYTQFWLWPELVQQLETSERCTEGHESESGRGLRFAFAL